MRRSAIVRAIALSVKFSGYAAVYKTSATLVLCYVRPKKPQSAQTGRDRRDQSVECTFIEQSRTHPPHRVIQDLSKLVALWKVAKHIRIHGSMTPLL